MTADGLSRAVEEHEAQQKIAPDLEDETKDDPNMVYVVASNYADDPHPHIEGVFSEKEEAEDLMDDCRKTTSPPHPVAWQLFETEIDGEVSLL